MTPKLYGKGGRSCAEKDSMDLLVEQEMKNVRFLCLHLCLRCPNNWIFGTCAISLMWIYQTVHAEGQSHTRSLETYRLASWYVHGVFNWPGQNILLGLKYKHI